MAKGRTPSSIKRQTIEVSLPATLVSRLNNLVIDPVTGRRPLYDRSQLIERLLREHLDKIDRLTFDDLVEE